MRYPALTRILALVLALLCLPMLLAGVLGLRSAGREHAKKQEEQERLSARIREYRTVSEALSGTVSYEQVKQDQEQRQEQHDEDAAKHKMDLATYTATQSGIEQGIAAMDEADAQFAAGVQQYLEGVEAFEQQEAEFWRGYEQFQEGKRQLEDGVAQYESMRGILQAAQAQLAGLTALRDVLDRGDIEDPEALRQEAMTAYEEALSAWEQAVGSTEALDGLGSLGPEQIQLLLTALAQNGGTDLDLSALTGVTPEQLQQLEASVTQATGMTPEQIRAALEDGYSQLQGMDPQAMMDPEQLALLQQLYQENRELVLTAIDALSGRLGELSEQLEAGYSQLEQAQAEMEQMENAMEAGMAALEEGRYALEEVGREIEAGEDALNEGREELWYQMGKLEEQEQELRQKKEQLDREADELTELERQAQQQKELEQRERNLRLGLLERENIARLVEEGETLLDAAQTAADDFALAAQQRYQGRMTCHLLMLLGALCGLLGIPGAFERVKKPLWRWAPILLCLGCATAVEILSRRLGLGDSYSALSVMVFACIQLLLIRPAVRAP